MKISLNRCIIFVLAIMFSFLTIASSLVLVSMFDSPTSIDVAAKPLIKAEATVKPKIDRNISQKLYPCLPKQAKELKLAGKVVSGKDSYHLVGIYGALKEQVVPSEESYEETLVKLDNIGCSVIIPKEQRGEKSLTQYIPANFACELEVQSSRQVIAKVGGTKKYEELLADRSGEEFPDRPAYFFPETACALKKLGVRLPKNSQVINNFDEFLSDTKHDKSK